MSLPREAGSGPRPQSSSGIRVVANESHALNAEEMRAQPCFEGYLRGAWLEVDILEWRPAEMFFVRYKHPSEGDVDACVSLDLLRLRAIKSEVWDCGFLQPGVDVSVFGRHPEAPTTRALYDANIISKTRLSGHEDQCCRCRFSVQYYSIRSSPKHGRERSLISIPTEVNISKLSILQQPGIIPLHEVIKAHISGKWETEQDRWSNDARSVKETLLRIYSSNPRGEWEESCMTTPPGTSQADSYDHEYDDEDHDRTHPVDSVRWEAKTNAHRLRATSGNRAPSKLPKVNRETTKRGAQVHSVRRSKAAPKLPPIHDQETTSRLGPAPHSAGGFRSRAPKLPFQETDSRLDLRDDAAGRRPSHIWEKGSAAAVGRMIKYNSDHREGNLSRTREMGQGDNRRGNNNASYPVGNKDSDHDSRGMQREAAVDRDHDTRKRSLAVGSKYPERGVKRKHNCVDENHEMNSYQNVPRESDRYPPGHGESSGLARRSKEKITDDNLRRQDQNVAQNIFRMTRKGSGDHITRPGDHKSIGNTEEAKRRKRLIHCKISDSESSPAPDLELQTLSHACQERQLPRRINVADNGCHSRDLTIDRGKTRPDHGPVVKQERRRLTEEAGHGELRKVHDHVHGNATRRIMQSEGPPAEQVPKGRPYGISKQEKLSSERSARRLQAAVQEEIGRDHSRSPFMQKDRPESKRSFLKQQGEYHPKVGFKSEEEQAAWKSTGHQTGSGAGNSRNHSVRGNCEWANTQSPKGTKDCPGSSRPKQYNSRPDSDLKKNVPSPGSTVGKSNWGSMARAVGPETVHNNREMGSKKGPSIMGKAQPGPYSRKQLPAELNRVERSSDKKVSPVTQTYASWKEEQLLKRKKKHCKRGLAKSDEDFHPSSPQRLIRKLGSRQNSGRLKNSKKKTMATRLSQKEAEFKEIKRPAEKEAMDDIRPLYMDLLPDEIKEEDAETLFNEKNHPEEKAAKDHINRPLYMDLFPDVDCKEEYDNDDDGKAKQAPVVVMEEKTNVGLLPSWNPEHQEESESECNVVTGLHIPTDEQLESMYQTLWGFNLPETPVVIEQTKFRLAGQDDDTVQQAEVCNGELDHEDPKCEHSCSLDDTLGLVCDRCGLVTFPIEQLIPEVGCSQPRSRDTDLDDWDFGTRSPNTNQGATGYEQVKNEESDVTMLSTCLPPHYAQQMHPHQKDGFEFLWRNLAHHEQGEKLRMRRADKNAGCILSHAPGTGKSFLVIAFLKSYMDKFPSCRPLIVAPKIMLLRWEKEFSRWKSDIKVFILNTATVNGKRLIQKHEESGFISLKKSNGVTNPKVAKDTCRTASLYEWTRKRSVCLVSYSLFSSLTDEEGSNPKSPEAQLVRKLLLESPGILILDEGHFPRNKGTRIRKALMKVQTTARILLSGTLFQNNFEELFNTLYLVRPGFSEAFPSCFRSDHGIVNKTQDDNLVEEDEDTENAARKRFMEEVGLKIEEGQLCKESNLEVQHGLERLQRLTADFVHHHTGEVLAILPGLRDFAILLKPTSLQCTLLALVERRFHRPDEYLKREIAVSEASIHPNLITKLEFFRGDVLKMVQGDPGVSESDLGAMWKEPTDPDDGVKTKFVFDLLRSLRSRSKSDSEKVLIFSQHISPLELLEDMFKAAFNWDKNRDVLRLDGKMPMNDREGVIERFNDPCNQAQILLASTRACGEGINLVGASRVVFLDVLWNPAVIQQAISRAFRLGQKKTVFVYRLIAMGTIEEKKYKKAIRKDWLSKTIFCPAAGEVADCLDQPAGETNLSPAEVLAWEVDATMCEDAILENLLNRDKGQANSFLKVVEHGSRFHNRKTSRGPDARDWFLDDGDYKDLSLVKETREGTQEVGALENTNPQNLASKLYQEFGETGTFDLGAASSSDTDEEFS